MAAETVNLHLKLPPLGKKPWKSDWDTNFTILDQQVGGLTVDGSVPAKVAETILGSALTPFVQSVSGDLATAAVIPAGESHEIRVDHTLDVVFDIPLSPIFTTPSTDVNVVLLGDRYALNNDEYGGVFLVRVENHATTDLNGADVSWIRKGLKFT